MGIQYAKVKSVAKLVTPKGPTLSEKVLATMRQIADVVGATLGPGGMPILIERPETGLPGLVTKDGVTVFRNLGFRDPVQHTVMESARDAAVRTVSEAGDGTTTATVLAEAIVRFTHAYVKRNPTVSPQRVVRRLERLFSDDVEPLIRHESIKADLSTPKGRSLLRAVAAVSANGDGALADKVMECFDLVGDEGNVTIAEVSGPSSYTVEKIEGFPVQMGYEESASKYMNLFINDSGNARCFLEKPKFILHFGAITNEQILFPICQRFVENWLEHGGTPNLVVVATGFSDSVISWMGNNVMNPSAPNIVPLLAPKSPVLNGERHFLDDLAAITGATVIDPLTMPVDQAPLEVLGRADGFESYRFRSTVFGRNDPDEVIYRVETIQAQLATAESQLDRMLLQERIGRITGGIARLKVIGASNGELKEKRDRAEDAVCAVRGAMKSGALPGGGWMLLKLGELLSAKYPNDPIVTDVLCPALAVPVIKLFSNVGMSENEIDATLGTIQADLLCGKHTVFDAMENKFVDAFEGGIMDSTPAVLEAIRNSISIASLLGTLGGVVVFERDDELERRESQTTNQFLRDAGVNEADDRW